MDITWYGHSCFRITDRGQITIVTDPFAEDIGLPALKVKGDVVTVSHDVPGHNFVEGVRGYQYVIYRAGEYEIGDVFITGIALDYVAENVARPNVGFLFDYGSLNVLHLGDLNHVPDQSSIEKMGQVNVLLIPVGGGNSLKAAEAAEVVALFEPNYVVPMHYGLPGLQFDLESVEKFLKAMGVSKPHEAETLKVSTSDLPEQTQVVVMTPMALSRNTENGG
ncbi:MAG: MBL fold metallo-hydrolase [Anaerolineae bacterium]|nr:MBL fold metallo-hydrolase [Anaerolineae bacterium]